MEWHEKLWPKFGDLAVRVAELDDNPQQGRLPSSLPSRSTVTGHARNFTDAEYARLYIEKFVEADLEKILRQIQLVRKQPYDISVATLNANIDSLTKRMTLVCDHSVITHSGFRQQAIKDDERYVSIEAQVPDLADLDAYLRSAHAMFRTGRLVYLPNLVRFQSAAGAHPSINLGPNGEWPTKIAGNIADFLVDGEHVVATATKAIDLQIRTLKPLLVLDLPYIEGTSLRDYFTICLEESDSLSSLQDYLRGKLLEVGPPGPFMDIGLAAIKREINEGIRQVRSELKGIRRKSAVQQAGAGIASVTAALLALNHGEFIHLMTTELGVSGGIGLWSSVTSVEEYLRTRDAIEQKPFYLLWLFSRKSTRL